MFITHSRGTNSTTSPLCAKQVTPHAAPSAVGTFRRLAVPTPGSILTGSCSRDFYSASALLHLTGKNRPSRARRSPPFCFVGSPSRESALRVRSAAAATSPDSRQFPQQCTPAHRFALGSG